MHQRPNHRVQDAGDGQGDGQKVQPHGKAQIALDGDHHPAGQIQQMEAGVDVREEYFTGLIRRLKKLEKLRAFELSMEEIRRQMPAGRTEKYLEQMRRVFLELVPVYEKRDEIEQAYFASLVEKFGIDKGHTAYDGLMDFMIRMVVHKGVFVRENALRALYMIGNKEAVLAAWEKMEDNEICHS